MRQHRENSAQLGHLENSNIFVAVTQAAKELRRYIKMKEVQAGSIQIEDVERTTVNEDIDKATNIGLV